MESTWLRRDVPILEAVSAAEIEEFRNLQSPDVIERTGLSARDVSVGLNSLIRSAYLTAFEANDAGDPDDYFMGIELLERGRREVGMWPREEAGLDVLLDLLTERIDEETDPEVKSRLTRFREAAQGIGKDVGASVLAAYIKSASRL